MNGGKDRKACLKPCNFLQGKAALLAVQKNTQAPAGPVMQHDAHFIGDHGLAEKLGNIDASLWAFACNLFKG